MRELFRRIFYLLNRRRFDRELAQDLEAHRELAALQGGMPLGNTLHLREEARDAWGWTWVDRFLQDLRYAGRMLRKSPGFTVMAVLMLALGTGVNIAAFGFFDFMVLRPLNVREPATLMRFHRRSPEAYSFVLPYPEMAFFREYAKSLSAVLALNFTTLSNESGEKLKSHFVTANWFADLGATAELGRLLDATRDEAPGADPAVVLGHGYWQRQFGGDPAIVGRVLRFDGKPATVIGIAPTHFTGLSLAQPDLWAPLVQQPYFSAGGHLLTDFSSSTSGVEMWGRLAPGVSPQAAQDELQSLAMELRRQHPADIWEKEGLVAEPSGYAESLLIGGRRGTGAEERDNLYPIAGVLGALALLILAVACGNLGSLLLARGVAREREISIRVAVGAGRARLVRQLLTESLVLALLGAGAGLFVGHSLLRVLMVSTGSPSWLDPTPDWRILAFTLGIAFTAAMLFGFTPAVQISRQRQRATFMRQFLVAAQVAASCILLIVAALLVRALDHAISGGPGFEYQNVIAINPGLSNHGYTAAASRNYLDTLESRVRSLPGVEALALTSVPPFGNATITGGIEVDGRSVDAALDRVDGRFFSTLSIPLLLGRGIVPGDATSVVISQGVARRLWPTESPLGKQLPFGNDAIGAPLQHTVVGVARSARMVKLEDPDLAQVYFPAGPADLPGMTVLVKTSGSPEQIVPLLASIAKSIDPKVYPEIDMLKSSLRRKLEAVQYGALAAGILGLAALALACLGIAGVVAFAVSQRSKEIGIRMALGANPSHVLSVILRQFTTPVAIGLLGGIGAAAALSGVARRVLFGISGLDPAAYLGAICIFLVTVAVAAWLPARRAVRVDPMRALRCD